MLKAGGGNWTHAISADGVHWYHIADALGRGPSNSTWDNQGACDGTVSFPDPKILVLTPSRSWVKYEIVPALRFEIPFAPAPSDLRFPSPPRPPI